MQKIEKATSSDTKEVLVVEFAVEADLVVTHRTWVNVYDSLYKLSHPNNIK